MPTTIEQLQEFLDEYDLRYRIDEERDAILIGFEIDPEGSAFRSPDGSPSIRMVIRVMERGEFLSVFCPQAWNVGDCPHKAAVFEAIASIQSQYKLLRFDYDPKDGELRPNIELPLEDSEITSRQFHRLIHGVLHGVQRFDGVIRHAMETGEVSFASVERMEDLEPPSPEVIRLHRLAEEVGGIDELERLVTGRESEAVTEAGPLADREAAAVDVAGDDDLTVEPDAEPDDGPVTAEPPLPVIHRLWRRMRAWDRLWIWHRIFGRGRAPGPGGRKAG